MRFAVSLLSVLAIASVIGTVLKQNEPYSNYVIQFGQFWFGFFDLLGLYDVYHAGWFLLILLFLVLSTSLCIYRNAPAMLREMRTFREQVTEKSLRAFSHQAQFALVQPIPEVQDACERWLQANGYRYKTIRQTDESVLLAAKAGSYQRLGYLLTHAAIVLICIGGLLDGNLMYKVQELLGQKQIETLDIPADEVPAKSRMPVYNLSFRANMTLPEGGASNVAFLRVRDGYLLQELPFGIRLKDFRIEHYATGQPKSFESDLEILDPALEKPMVRTIAVNHPLIYKGIAIYQSDFQDGGSRLGMRLWPLFSAQTAAEQLRGVVHGITPWGEGATLLKLEFNDFRLFNILNLSPDGKGKPRNVGPSIQFKVRDAQGQATEYINYMQPVQLDGHAYFVSGMRQMQQADFKYLRLPADASGSLTSFMRLRAMLFNTEKYPQIASRYAKQALPADSDPTTRNQFEAGVVQLLSTFARGGFVEVAGRIDSTVPADVREKAAQTYLKMIAGAAVVAYRMSFEDAGEVAPPMDDNSLGFIHDSLNTISDSFFYGTPFYLQLSEFEQREASGLQLARSPGKNLVYLGSLLLVAGIFAMIYIRERRVWLWLNKTSLLFAMSSNRKNRDFEMEFEQMQQALRLHLTAEQTASVPNS